MSTNLREINIKRPDADTITKLEQLLELAKSGDILGIAAVTVNRERIVSTTFSNDLQIDEAIYGVTVLRLRLERMIE